MSFCTSPTTPKNIRGEYRKAGGDFTLSRLHYTIDAIKNNNNKTHPLWYKSTDHLILFSYKKKRERRNNKRGARSSDLQGSSGQRLKTTDKSMCSALMCKVKNSTVFHVHYPSSPKAMKTFSESIPRLCVRRRISILGRPTDRPNNLIDTRRVFFSALHNISLPPGVFGEHKSATYRSRGKETKTELVPCCFSFVDR